LQKADPLREYAAETAPSRGDWKEALRALLRPAAWPAWTMATVAAMAIFAVGMLFASGCLAWGVIAPTELTAQMPKPALERHADGTLTLGIGATGAKPEAVALFREAMRFYDQPDFAERAVPFLERAVAADAQYEQPRFWLGICLLTQGRTSAAIPQLEEAARLAPGNVTYQHYLVWGYLKAGEYTKALAAQTRLLKRRAVRLSPSAPVRVWARGTTCLAEWARRGAQSRGGFGRRDSGESGPPVTRVSDLHPMRAHPVCVMPFCIVRVYASAAFWPI